MDSDPGMPALLLALLIALHAFFASAEVAVVSVGKARLHQISAEGRPSARLIASLAGNATRLLTTTQLAIKLFGFLTVALAVHAYSGPLAVWLAGMDPFWPASQHQLAAALLITLSLVVVVLVTGELLPRALATRYPEPIALAAIYPLVMLGFVATPLVRLAAALNRLLTGDRGPAGSTGLPLVTEQQIKTLVDAGEEGGVIEEEEKEMIYSIFELGDTLVNEVMVPRIDVAALEVKTSLKDALAVIVQAGHSRIPVYEDTVDTVVGILYAKDLLRYWPDFETLNLRDILRDAYFVPETKPVDELLQELQQRKVHIAIVVDEYGGVAGLVTIEDVLEEIVGEIQDEYDTEEAFVERISPEEAIFDGRTDLHDVNDAMGIDLPTGTSDTLGGLIHSSLGRLATIGDWVRVGDVELRVISMLGRGIRKVHVARLPSHAPAGADNTASWDTSSAEDAGPAHESSGSQPEAESLQTKNQEVAS